MTRDEILAMKAGPELDEQIAIRLFGWRWCATDGGYYNESMTGGKKGKHVDARVRRFLQPGWDTGKYASRWKELNTVECSEADMALPIGYSYYPDWPQLSYSQTWEGMRLVVEALGKKGWFVRLDGPDNYDGNWCAHFRSRTLVENAIADTAPHAVALAAMLAVGGGDATSHD